MQPSADIVVFPELIVRLQRNNDLRLMRFGQMSLMPTSPIWIWLASNY